MSGTGHGSNSRVAVLGTGIMGSAMARNLISAGMVTTVWNRSAPATDALAQAGATVAASAKDAVRHADIVITMLPTAEVVDSVMLDANVVSAFKQGSVWAQMGTIGAEATSAFAGALGSLRPDVMFVDAPVSGRYW